jgi:hypothetical protein
MPEVPHPGAASFLSTIEKRWVSSAKADDRNRGAVAGDGAAVWPNDVTAIDIPQRRNPQNAGCPILRDSLTVA